MLSQSEKGGLGCVFVLALIFIGICFPPNCSNYESKFESKFESNYNSSVVDQDRVGNMMQGSPNIKKYMDAGGVMAVQNKDGTVTIVTENK